MQPQDPHDSGSTPPDNTTAPAYRHGQPVIPPREVTPVIPARDAALSVIRAGVDSVYNQQAGIEPAPVDSLNNPNNEAQTPQNPYLRTHTEPTATTSVEQEWKAYHSAWQDYYQKYYEGYYTTQLEETKAKVQVAPAQPAANPYFVNEPPEETPASNQAAMSRDEALYTLRQHLLENVRNSASKVRHSRHFVPILSAALVVLLFVFLQYNQIIIGTVQAYVSPGSINPQNIVIDPATDTAVSPDPVLIIPKINVDVPVEWGVGNDYTSQMAAMAKGVAQFAIPGADSYPGQKGNTVLAGHSSNDLFDGGDYKFIFAQLDRLNTGDNIYIDYQSVRYTYTITSTKVVAPNDVAALQTPETKPTLTLITCTPVGTAKSRLLIFADQVSPDPAGAKPAPDDTSSSAPQPAEIPGTQPSVIQRLFGAK